MGTRQSGGVPISHSWSNFSSATHLSSPAKMFSDKTTNDHSGKEIEIRQKEKKTVDRWQLMGEIEKRLGFLTFFCFLGESRYCFLGQTLEWALDHHLKLATLLPKQYKSFINTIYARGGFFFIINYILFSLHMHG